MRILVTGAGGQVGAEVVALLTGHDVVAADHATLDIADRRAVDERFASSPPELVINCGAATNVDGCETEVDHAFAVNALAVRWLAQASTRVGAHLVHVSTDYVFPGDKQGPYDEWDDTGPRSAYGRSKLAGERELMVHAASWTLARTSWVFGRRGKNFVDTIAAKALAGDALRVVDDQFGSPTYAPDLATMLVRLGLDRTGGLFHVTNQGATSWHGLAADVVELLGLDRSTVATMSSSELPRPAPRPANSVLENRALRLAGLPLLRHYREALADRIAEMPRAEVGAS
jgi:dTDP-4-dehydrorhamnose reductase